MTFPIYGKIKVMFQTTNQIMTYDNRGYSSHKIPWTNHHVPIFFPMLFLLIIIFLWFSYGFPMVFLFISWSIPHWTSPPRTSPQIFLARIRSLWRVQCVGQKLTLGSCRRRGPRGWLCQGMMGDDGSYILEVLKLRRIFKYIEKIILDILKRLIST